MAYECSQYWDTYYRSGSPYHVESGASHFNYRCNPNFSFGYAMADKSSAALLSQPKQPVQKVRHFKLLRLDYIDTGEEKWARPVC